MIKTRSTYYIDAPLDVSGVPLDSYTLDVYIWSGDYSAKPLTPEYSLTNYNQESNIGYENINISNLLHDYITINLATLGTTQIVDSNNALWCEVVWEDTTTLLSDTFSIGYDYPIQTDNTSKILLQGDEYNVNRNSSFILPIETDALTFTAISYPNSEINFSETLTTTTNANESVKNAIINISDTTVDEYIELTYNGNTKTIYIKDEYKYTPLDIHFINKEGFQQVLTFFKERKDSLKVDKENYERKGINIVDGEHQFKDYNINSKSSFSINSGFIEESNNEVFKQLLLSEYVWCYDNGYIPLNIETSSLEYQNRVNDKLIKYTIDFSYSFNDIEIV